VRLPEDLSIVGYDDVMYATIVTPALTTVRQPLADMGRTAVHFVVRLLEAQHLGSQQIELPTGSSSASRPRHRHRRRLSLRAPAPDEADLADAIAGNVHDHRL
jgi:hypothetical protein